jgi:hypothetical protein
MFLFNILVDDQLPAATALSLQASALFDCLDKDAQLLQLYYLSWYMCDLIIR